MTHSIRGTLAAAPVSGTDQAGRPVTQLRIAVTPQVRRLRRGERREDYIRVALVYLNGLLSHDVPLGSPVTVTGAQMSRPASGQVWYRAAAQDFSWR